MARPVGHMVRDQQGIWDLQYVSLLHVPNYCFESVRFVFCSFLVDFTGVTCRAEMLQRQIGWSRPLSVLINTPPTEMFGTPSPRSAMQPRPHRVCGSTDCCGFIRLHISVVSIELRPPPPLVALLVCLPVAAVTVEAEQAHWFSSPQQAYCCCCSHFSIYGSVYLARALSVCTAIKIL